MIDCSFENRLLNEGYKYVLGIDEVGRGCWAGPLVVGCYVYKSDSEYIKDVDDSKKLSRKKREELNLKLMNATYSLGWSHSHEIDEMHLVNAIRLAIKRSLKKLSVDDGKCIILIDGNINYDLGMESRTIIDGDAKHFSIAAASILAKVYRDRWMRRLHKKYPFYSFDTNVGYGTRKHREALGKYGVCEIHRKFYRPIQQLLLPV